MVKTNLKTLLLAASFLMPASLAGAQSALLPVDPSANATVTVQPATNSDAKESRVPAGLVPFGEPTADFELSGESDTQEFTFRLNGIQAGQGGNLVIAYKNAVSVLPDTGMLKVEVNGKPAGEIQIAAPFDTVNKKIALPAAYLRPGVNTVRIAALQHHRVDCSMSATYELWTRLSPTSSGFEPRSKPAFNAFADLYAVGRMDDGATEVRLVLPAAANADMLNAASEIVQALTLYLGREDVIVTVADRPGEGPGIDLFAGIGTADASVAGGLRRYAEAPYGVTVRASDDPARAAVIFRAESVENLYSLLLEAVRGPMADGLKSVRETRHYGLVHAAAEQDFSLKDTGFRSTSFGGRLMRTRFDVVMPADFYAAEYGTFDIKLRAATAPGLDPSAQMLVRVNDEIVNSFPFRNTDGQKFDGKLIELPLRAFRPGVNKVEMLAELPNASDKACAPSRDDSKPRYVLSDQTTFSVPPLARVTRLPDLAAFSGNAYPYAGGKPFDIYLERADSHSASAAMNVLARLSMTSGAPLKGSFRLERPAPDAKGDALVISAEQVDAFNSAGQKNRIMANAFLVGDAAAGVMTGDAMPTAAIAENVTQGVGNDDQLMQAFENNAASGDVERSWTTRFKIFLSNATGRFGNWLHYEDVKPVQIASANTLLTIVQTARPDDAGTLTEIHAATSYDLSRGIRRLTDPTNWQAMDGGAALIDAKTLDLVNIQGQRQAFAEVTEQSVGNYRRIMAAWLSDNFQIYVLLVIVLVGLFAGWLGVLVQRKGVRTV